MITITNWVNLKYLFSYPTGQQQLGGSGFWENGGSADHDGAGEALLKHQPHRLHYQSSRPLNITSALQQPVLFSSITPTFNLSDNLV